MTTLRARRGEKMLPQEHSMPNGRTHDSITLVTASFAAPISLGLAFDGNPGRAILLLGSYLVSGLLFSDDLDIDSIEYRRWRLLGFLWLPYQKLVPHRSPLSHGLIIGPALRILYFAAVCTLALWLGLLALSRALPLDAHGLVGDLLSAIARSIIDHPDGWAIALLGFIGGGLSHTVADWLWTWWRHVWRGPEVRVPPSATDAGAEQPAGFGQRMSIDVREEGAEIAGSSELKAPS